MNPLPVFNGPIEVGLRALILLVETFPEALDLQQLVTLDYFIIHSGDVDGGPESIHPPSPLRSGEVAIRRGLIEDGLKLYRMRGLISQEMLSVGIAYVAEDSAAAFLDAFKSPYVEQLRQRAEWVVATFGVLNAEELGRVLKDSFLKWRTEFVVLASDGDGV